MRPTLEVSLLLVVTKFLLGNILDLSIVSVSFEVVISQQWRHLVLLPHFRREPTDFGINLKMREVGNNLHVNLNLNSRISFFTCLNISVWYQIKIFVIF